MQKRMQMLGTIAWLLTMLCGAASGQIVTVRVHSSVCSGGTCFGLLGCGTGVVVANEGNASLILTAAHNFDLTDRNGYPTRNGQINAIHVAGRTRAELLRRWNDGTMDLAVLRAYGTFPAIPLAETPPAPGDNVTINGYDFADTSHPELRATTCRVIDVDPGQQAHTSRSWPVGTSGGAVIDAAGNLVGIAVTSNGFIVNRNFRQVVLSLARRAEFPPPNVIASADAGQPAAAESGPSSQGETQDASTQPAASEIQRYERDAIAKLRSELDALKAQQAATQDADPPRGQPPPGLQDTPSDTSEQSTEGTRERTVSPPAGGVEPQGSASSDAAEKPERPGTAEPEDTPFGDTDAAAGPVAAADRLERVGDAAESILSDPLVQAGIWAAVGVATGGTGLVAKPYVGAAWALICAERRRRKKKKAGQSSTAAPSQPSPPQEADGDSPDGFPRLHDRDLEEAKQLVRLGQLEGRNPLLDSFMGMSFGDVLESDLSDNDLPDDVRRYAEGLQGRVKQRVDAAAPLSTGKPYSDSWRGTRS